MPHQISVSVVVTGLKLATWNRAYRFAGVVAALREERSSYGRNAIHSYAVAHVASYWKRDWSMAMTRRPSQGEGLVAGRPAVSEDDDGVADQVAANALFLSSDMQLPRDNRRCRV